MQQIASFEGFVQFQLKNLRFIFEFIQKAS
jgi:hypothetical protein